MTVDTAGHTRLADLPDDPWELFAGWRHRAAAVPEVQYPEAMCLATVSPRGRPEARFVIVHHVAPRQLVFLTDERSPKAAGLGSGSSVALAVYWPRPLELQTRIEGVVEPAPDALADEIFARRPRRSQAIHRAARQSQPTTLARLTAALDRVDEEWKQHETLPRPPHWRGYRVVPSRFEFWQARARRLHDRVLYTRGDGGWERVRLAP